jgi:glycylpeptide N-tetradecanoyltransferase
VEAYVVESPAGVITDLVSFYNLPSSILGHPEHTELKAAYMYYTGMKTVTGYGHISKGILLVAGCGVPSTCHA